MPNLSFEEIMNFAPSNKLVFERIKNSIKLIIPFAGAGLSAFTFPTWRSCLREIGEHYLTKEQYLIFSDMLKIGAFEDAAAFLEDCMGKVNFYAVINSSFSEAKIDDVELQKQAVFLIPILFNSFILTTNFDRIIEHAYKLNGQELKYIGHPGHSDILSAAIRTTNPSLLYKFHGDIGQGLDSINNIVLTSAQYNLFYEHNDILINDLKRCFKSRSLLFLGASLEKDRTMNVLESVIETGSIHYAILDCAKEAIFEKYKELDNRNILPILYPEGEYSSLRIILERLLEEIDYEKYLSLQYYVTKNNNNIKLNPFSYKQSSADFAGRKEELNYLNEFINCNDYFSWWVISGLTGSGKSRLAFEFAKEVESEWDVRLDFGANFTFEMFTRETLVTKKTLFIIENAEVNVREIGKWLSLLSKQYSTIKKRVLLLCQSGNSLKDAIWSEILLQQGREELYESFYREDGLFCGIPPIDPKDAMLIMKSYAKNVANILLEEDVASSLVQKFINFDSYLRPIYAILVIDVWLHNNNSLIWKKDRVFNFIVDKSVDTITKKCEAFFPNMNIEQINSLLNLISISSIAGGMKSEEIISQFEDYRIISTFANPLRVLSMLDASNYKFEIQSIEPGLIRAYFVLQRLIKDYYINTNIWKKSLLKIWELYPQQATYFYNILFGEFSQILDGHTEIVKSLIAVNKNTEDNSFFRGALFSIIPFYSNNEISDYSMNEMGNLLEVYPNDINIVSLYIKSVCNYVMHFDNPLIINELKKAKKIVMEKGNNKSLMVLYAKVVVNLLSHSKAEFYELGRMEIQELYSRLNDEALAIVVARGVYNLVVYKSIKSNDEIKMLSELRYKYPQSDEIICESVKSYFFILKEYKRIIEFGKNMAALVSGEKESFVNKKSHIYAGQVEDSIDGEVLGEFYEQKDMSMIIKSMDTPNIEMASDIKHSIEGLEDKYKSAKKIFYENICIILEETLDCSTIEFIIAAGMKYWTESIEDIEKYVQLINILLDKKSVNIEMFLIEAKAYLLSYLLYYAPSGKYNNIYKQIFELALNWPNNLEVQTHCTRGVMYYFIHNEEEESIYEYLDTLLKNNESNDTFRERFENIYECFKSRDV